MNLPQASAPRKHLGRPLWIGMLAILNVLLLYAAVLSPTGWSGYRNKRQQVRILEEKTSEIRNAAQDLFREVERLKHDERHMERRIRKELGWVAPGEILVQFVPPPHKPPEPSPKP